MTTAERKVKSILFEERRTLIDSGIERKQIKIRGNSIYINKTKVSSANEDIFIRYQQLQDESQDLIPTRHDTNTNILSATANTNNVLSATAASASASSSSAASASSSSSSCASSSSANHAANTTVNVRSTNDEHSQRAQTDGRPHSSSPLSTNSNSLASPNLHFNSNHSQIDPITSKITATVLALIIRTF